MSSQPVLDHICPARRRSTRVRSGASPGPVVVASGLRGVRLYNVVRVGDAALPGEVIRLDGEPRNDPGLRGHGGPEDRRAGTRHRPAAGSGARSRDCSAASSTARNDRSSCWPATARTPSAARCSRAASTCRRSIASASGGSSRASPTAPPSRPGICSASSPRRRRWSTASSSRRTSAASCPGSAPARQGWRSRSRGSTIGR